MDSRRTGRERCRVAGERMQRILREGVRDAPRDDSFADDHDESGVSTRYRAGALDASSSRAPRRAIDV